MSLTIRIRTETNESNRRIAWDACQWSTKCYHISTNPKILHPLHSEYVSKSSRIHPDELSLSNPTRPLEEASLRRFPEQPAILGTCADVGRKYSMAKLLVCWEECKRRSLPLQIQYRGWWLPSSEWFHKLCFAHCSRWPLDHVAWAYESSISCMTQSAIKKGIACNECIVVVWISCVHSPPFTLGSGTTKLWSCSSSFENLIKVMNSEESSERRRRIDHLTLFPAAKAFIQTRTRVWNEMLLTDAEDHAATWESPCSPTIWACTDCGDTSNFRPIAIRRRSESR